MADNTEPINPAGIEGVDGKSSTGSAIEDLAAATALNSNTRPGFDPNSWNLNQRPAGFVEVQELKKFYGGPQAQFDLDSQTALGQRGQQRFDALIAKAGNESLTPREVEELVMNSRRLQTMVGRSRQQGATPLTEAELIPEQQTALANTSNIILASIENLNSIQELSSARANRQLSESLPFVDGQREFEAMNGLIRDKAQRIYEASADRSLSREAWSIGVRPIGYTDISALRMGRDSELFSSVVEDIYGREANASLVALERKASLSGIGSREAQQLGIMTLKINREFQRRKESGIRSEQIPQEPEEAAQESLAQEQIASRLSSATTPAELVMVRSSLIGINTDLPFIDGKREFQLVNEAARQKAQAIYEKSGSKILTSDLWSLGVRPEGYIDIDSMLKTNPQQARSVIVELYGPEGAKTIYDSLASLNRRGQLNPRQVSELTIKSIQINRALEAKLDSAKPYDATQLLPEQQTALDEANRILSERISTLTLEQITSSPFRQALIQEVPYVDNEREFELLKKLITQRAQLLYEQGDNKVISDALWREGVRPPGFIDDYREQLRTSNLQVSEVLNPFEANQLKTFEGLIQFHKPLNPDQAQQYAQLTSKIASEISKRKSAASEN